MGAASERQFDTRIWLVLALLIISDASTRFGLACYGNMAWRTGRVVPALLGALFFGLILRFIANTLAERGRC